MTNDAPRTDSAPRLVRSTADRRLLGVSGGLGAYFSVDPVLFRIGFVVAALMGGAGVIAYLAAALLVPNADHAAAAVGTPVPAA